MYMIRISMNIKAYYLSIKQNMQYNRRDQDLGTVYRCFIYMQWYIDTF